MSYSPGLAGIIAGETTISKVDVEARRLYYRGYDINQLCESSTYLEVAYVLLHGELPSQQELHLFIDSEKSFRTLPAPLTSFLHLLPSSSHPMDWLRGGISLLGSTLPANMPSQGCALHCLAKMPVILAQSYRLSRGLEPIEPDSTLDYSENFLYMLLGEIPDPLIIHAFEVSLILYAEHGFNASTFAARVTTSTNSDFFSAVCSAIGTLKGNLHGGANEKVMAMLQDIATPARAEPYLMDLLKRKEKVMGFGHRLYTKGDSRSDIMWDYGQQLAEKFRTPLWHEISEVLQAVMLREKKLFANLDFPAASAYKLMGIETQLYTPLFASSRIAGWSAHIIEQQNNNRIIRPSCLYTGPETRLYTPIDQR